MASHGYNILIPFASFIAMSCFGLMDSGKAAGIGPSFTVVTDLFPATRSSHQEEMSATEWILALDEAKSQAARTRITDQLKKLGPETLQAIKTAPQGLSRQTELTLQRIANEIEKNINSKRTRATRITLVGEFQSDEVFAAIQSQTGIRFFGKTESDLPARKWQLEDVVFWQAVDQILDAYQLAIGDDSSPGIIHVVDAALDRKKLHNRGYSSLLRAQAISYSTGARKSPLAKDRLKVEIRWEPSITPTQIVIDHKKIFLKTRSGKVIRSTKSDKVNYQVQRQQTHVVVDLEFEKLSEGPKSLASAKLLLDLTAPLGKKEFVFDDLEKANAQSLRHADMKVTLDSTTATDENQCKVDMKFFLDNAGDSLESHRGWMFQNLSQLVDAKGNRILPSRIVTTMQKKDRMGFSFFFEKPDGPAGCKFIYQSPTSIQKIPIEIEINNIELE